MTLVRHQGGSVILSEHTHCERPYLPTFKKKLKSLLGTGVQIEVSSPSARPSAPADN